MATRANDVRCRCRRCRRLRYQSAARGDYRKYHPFKYHWDAVVVIPSEVEGSRGGYPKLSQRDPSTTLGMTEKSKPDRANQPFRISRARSSAASMFAQMLSRPIRSTKPE